MNIHTHTHYTLWKPRFSNWEEIKNNIYVFQIKNYLTARQKKLRKMKIKKTYSACLEKSVDFFKNGKNWWKN